MACQCVLARKGADAGTSAMFLNSFIRLFDLVEHGQVRSVN